MPGTSATSDSPAEHLCPSRIGPKCSWLHGLEGVAIFGRPRGRFRHIRFHKSHVEIAYLRLLNGFAAFCTEV